MSLNFSDLNQRLLSNSTYYLAQWLPGGQLHGREFCCGSLRGESGESLKINVQTGLWKDFATGESGRDLIALYAAVHNCSMGEAYRALDDRPAPEPKPKKQEIAVKPKQDIYADENFSHPKFGPPTLKHGYRDEQGKVVVWACRYDPPKGRKTFLPWKLNGKGYILGAPDKRILYNLDQLKSRPQDPVVIVEGEKCADIASDILKPYVVTTWQGGAQAVSKTDFTPLKNRNILIWPDADEAGHKALEDLIDVLTPLASKLRYLQVTDMPDGWDAGDAFKTDAWSMSDWVNWGKPRVQEVSPKPLTPELLPTLPEVEDPGPEPDEEQGGLITDWARNELSRCGVAFNARGMPVSNVNSAYLVLSNSSEYRGRIVFDEFKAEMLIDNKPWQDWQAQEILNELQGRYCLHSLGKSHVEDAIVLTAQKNRINSARDWLLGLAWDQEQRVNHFFSKYYGARDNEYAMAVSTNFWVALAARIMRPGCKVDNMVVLEGPQGIKKSSSLSTIAGPEWFGEVTTHPDNKDFMIQLHGKILVEVAELDSFRKADVTSIKRILSSGVDKFRPPYGKTVVDYPRTCLFVGTTNEAQYLKDTTGNRRFWPIESLNVDLESIARDREQLFAEALVLFKSGQSWWHVPESALQEQADRTADDVWLDAIAESVLGKPEVNMHDILLNPIGFDDLARVRKSDEMRVAQCLRQIGYKRHRKRGGGVRTYTWLKEITAEEAQAAKDSKRSLIDMLNQK